MLRAPGEAESPPTVIPMQNSPFRTHQGIVRRLDLNGAMLKPDESGNKALYGKPIKNGEIVGGGAATPAVAQRFVSKLTSLLYPESSTP